MYLQSAVDVVVFCQGKAWPSLSFRESPRLGEYPLISRKSGF